MDQVACVVKPETILGIVPTCGSLMGLDSAPIPEGLGSRELSELVVRMARENPGWGYDRIVGALSNLGQKLSDQTVSNILHRHWIPPARKRIGSATWKDFIAAHMTAPTFSRSKC